MNQFAMIKDMKTAIILHGTLGSPDGNWFQWLKNELEQRGLTVWLPQLPHPEQPSLQEWQQYVQKECPFAINEETLIVGHSSGAVLRFEWDAIRANTKKLVLYNSDDDPYVPLNQARYVADNCQAELITIPGQGHFNLEKSGEYKQFPKLLEIIEQGVI